MGTATIIIQKSGFVLMCADWDIEDIRDMGNGVKAICDDRGSEITIPSYATETKEPGDEHEECICYRFDDIEIYVEFF